MDIETRLARVALEQSKESVEHVVILMHQDRVRGVLDSFVFSPFGNEHFGNTVLWKFPAKSYYFELKSLRT